MSIHNLIKAYKRAFSKEMVKERIKVKFHRPLPLQKNHYLAKSISDVSWSKFVEFLKYKSKWYGAKLIQIDKFAPTSKTCSVCGYVIDKLPLSKRVWTCLYCNTTHDRDVNASINILKFALSGTEQPVKPVETPHKRVCEAGSPDLFALAKS